MLNRATQAEDYEKIESTQRKRRGKATSNTARGAYPGAICLGLLHLETVVGDKLQQSTSKRDAHLSWVRKTEGLRVGKP